MRPLKALTNIPLGNVLIIACHFPSHAGSSGLLRSLNHAAILRSPAGKPRTATCRFPQKAYGYLRIGKPILALNAPTGDIAALPPEVRGATMVNIVAEDKIYEGMSAFVDALLVRTRPLPDKDKIQRYTCEAQAGQLAKVLDWFTGKSPPAEERGDGERRELTIQPLEAKTSRHQNSQCGIYCALNFDRPEHPPDSILAHRRSHPTQRAGRSTCF